MKERKNPSTPELILHHNWSRGWEVVERQLPPKRLVSTCNPYWLAGGAIAVADSIASSSFLSFFAIIIFQQLHPPASRTVFLIHLLSSSFHKHLRWAHEAISTTTTTKTHVIKLTEWSTTVSDTQTHLFLCWLSYHPHSCLAFLPTNKNLFLFILVIIISSLFSPFSSRFLHFSCHYLNPTVPRRSKPCRTCTLITSHSRNCVVFDIITYWGPGSERESALTLLKTGDGLLSSKWQRKQSSYNKLKSIQGVTVCLSLSDSN